MIRLQKIISQSGITSRRKAEELIIKGKVIVNGKIAQIGDKATFNDQIIVDGNLIFGPEEFVYYLINKPPKVITSLKDPQNRTVITDLINEKKRIFPVGRLDYDTTGTLILTNDGELAHRLMHPSYEVTRVYKARINSPLTDQQIDFLNSDQTVINGKPSRQEVTKVGEKTYLISLKLGTYHHVKKLFELFGLKVVSLTRIEYAGISHVNTLSEGQFRRLNIKEIRFLKKLVKLI